jgi:hypothetical protein
MNFPGFFGMSLRQNYNSFSFLNSAKVATVPDNVDDTFNSDKETVELVLRQVKEALSYDDDNEQECAVNDLKRQNLPMESAVVNAVNLAIQEDTLPNRRGTASATRKSYSSVSSIPSTGEDTLHEKTFMEIKKKYRIGSSSSAAAATASAPTNPKREAVTLAPESEQFSLASLEYLKRYGLSS